MKIAVPADGNSTASGVCVSFGRAPYFLIYDSESKEATFIENDAAATPGGAGIRAAQRLVDSGVGALIAPRCGENAAEVLVAAGISIFRAAQGSAMDNVAAFIDGKLSPLDEIHPGFHGHGGR